MIEVIVLRIIKMSGKIRGKKRKEIYEIIKKAKTISLNEIRTLTTINYNTIRSAVINLTKAGLIQRVERGVYRVS
jgi:predicted transcriptional regulator of viral defense system